MTRRPTSNYDTPSKLEGLLKDRPTIRQLAEDWDEGFGVGGDTAGHGKGGHSDRAAAEAVRGMADHDIDPTTGELVATTIPVREGHGLTDLLRSVDADVAAAITLINRAATTWARTKPMPQGAAEMKTRIDQATPGAGWCIVKSCATYCTGALNDRIKAGYCPACYRAWLRYADTEQAAGREPSRAVFIDERLVTKVTDHEAVDVGNPTHHTTNAVPSELGGGSRPADGTPHEPAGEQPRPAA